jgi:endonuclease/exonuclease/phosphatase family metal-dependent hydrolase
MRPTRDILYVQGETQRGDTLHLFIVHAPSRYGGELETRPYRRQVTDILTAALDTLSGKDVLVTGDFNDYADSPSLVTLGKAGLLNVSAEAQGAAGRATGTYRYHGEWHSLDHLLLSPTLAERMDSIYINDATFLLEPENTYGGWKPRRTYNGYRYQQGFSDHLPLVLRLRL